MRVLRKLPVWLGLGLILASNTFAGWYDRSWPYRQEISIQPTLADAALIDFPYLVKIVDPANPVFANAQLDGDDILFTDSTGTLKLDHEIEDYDSVAKVLLAWVRVPVISPAAPTDIFLYYGNGLASSQENVEDTWNDDYVLVQHLEETGGTSLDSTGNDNDGTPLGGLNQSAAGQIDGADEFDGTDDYINIPDSASLRLVPMTVEAWVYIPDPIPSGFQAIVQHAHETSDWYGLWKSDNGDMFHYRWSTGSVRRTDFSQTILPDSWYHVAGVLDPAGTTAYAYLNGDVDTAVPDPDPPVPAVGPTYIGAALSGPSEWFRGTVDEVRISKVPRSATWLKATFRNLDDPAAHETLGAEQDEASVTSLAGTVYEDTDGDSGLGDAVGAAGVRVRLYADLNDDGTVDAGDTFLEELLTNTSGVYSFDVDTGVNGTDYLIAVDSRTVVPNGASPFNGGFDQGDVWAEQTYGDDPGTPALDLGPRVGGRNPGTSDDVDPVSTAPTSNVYQHLARVDVSGGDATGVDFALSFQVVSHTADRDDDTGADRTTQGSLRQAVQNANAIAGAGTFAVPAGVHTLALTGAEDAALTADLDLTDDLTILGVDPATAIVDGGALERVFEILAGTNATLSGLTVRNGTSGGVPGGGIRNVADLTLTNTIVTANLGDDFGGGIYSEGASSSLVLTNTTVSGNTADRGGGLYVLDPGGVFSLTDSTLSGNSSGVEGGGLRLEAPAGSVTFNRVTVSGNSSPKGAGMHFKSSGTASLENVTLSGNTATSEGGGIRNEGHTLSLTNVTITANSVPAGKGGGHQEKSGTTTLKNTIIAGNTGGDCSAGLTSGGYNLDSDGTCGLGGVGDKSSGSPNLGPLANNGGPTQTHVLLTPSDAIDAVLAGCPPPGIDQRSVLRPIGANCDMGAFEAGAGEPAKVLSGKVFEDADFAGTATDWDGGATDVGLPNVDVELYGAADAYVTSVTTDANGDFSFFVGDGNYKVRARSATIGDDPGGPDETAPGGGFNACVPATCPVPLPEMAWADGAAAYGGQDPTVDDTTTGDDAGPGDTWTAVSISGSDVEDVNLGFAYNLIVTAADAGQGSLRRFLLNANAVGQAGGTTASSSQFRIPTSDPNYNAGTGVFTVSLAGALPTITDSDTTLDATTQTTNVGDTNAGVVGTGGTVGVDAVALPRYDRPELAIDANQVDGIEIGGTASSVLLKGLALYDTVIGVEALAGGGTNRTAESMLVGTLPDGTDPGAERSTGRGIQAADGGQLTVTRCYVGWNGLEGVEADNSTSTLEITYSEVFGNCWNDTFCDGIDLNGVSNIARYNLSRDNTTSDALPRKGAGNGIECGSQTAGTGNHIVENNTSHGNVGAGIVVRNGTTGVTVRRNIVYDNEVGVAVDIEGSGQTDQNTIAENRIYQNVGLGIDLHEGISSSPFDGVTLNDDGDGDSGSNQLFNFPILEQAGIVGTNLELKGWARPGTVIELFEADVDPSGFGEGRTHLITLTEGGTGSGGSDPYADVDSSASAYGPGAINGLLQGEDTTNRFRFLFPVPGGVADGTPLTLQGTDGSGNGSEFSGNASVTTLTSISGTVLEDVDGDAGLGDAVGVDRVRVRIYADTNDDGLVDAGDSFVDELTTSGGGVYAFGVDTGATGNQYLIAVDSRTVPPNGASPFNGGFDQGDVWAEQTYGDDPTTPAIDLGPRVGGRSSGTSDDVDPASTTPGNNDYQHLGRADVTGGDVSGLDFALSFQVISHTADRDDDTGADRTTQGSLRQAVQNANAIAGAGTLAVPAGVHTLALSGAEDAALTADLDLTDDLTINGVDPTTAIVDGGALERVFDILAGTNATIAGLTIRNGTSGGVEGGGIRNVADLTLTNTIVTANLGDDFGGGIHSSGASSSLVLTNTIVSANTASGGGGIYAIATGGVFSLTDVTLSGNSGTAEGGGLRMEAPTGAVTLTRSTIDGNSSSKGGGILFRGAGTASLENVTVSGNSATSEGGGVRNDGHSLSLTNLTITANSAPATKGGGHQNRSGSTTLKHTIIANNTGGDCSVGLTSGGYNLDSDGTCGLGGVGDISNGNADLDSLADNGGPTQTHALLPSSDAIDAVLADCPPPGTDQRSLGRPVDGDGDTVADCDIGAFESQSVPILISGKVFEDADFAGTASDWDGGTGDEALPGVDVELYDAADLYLASTVTDVNGDYSFVVGDGTYKVRVRSVTAGDADTVPKGTYNACVPGTCPYPLPEMTWGDGVAMYGGQDPMVDDTATGDDAGPGDAWVTVVVSGAGVGGINLGLAHNLIVNTNDSGQGSLRQFILNANAIGPTGTTANSSEFRIPTSDPNYSAGTGVFTITPPILLPPMADAGTTLDASTQGDNTTQTNAGNLGAGGKVGVDQLDLSTVPAPEIEIAGAETLIYGLQVTAGGATLRGLAIYGFGLGNTGEGNIFVADGITGPLIEQNVVGSGAAAFTDPGSGFRGWENIYSDGADNGTIRNNLIGFGGTRGILLAQTSLNWTIEDNEIRDNSLEDEFGDGLAIDPGQADVTGNLIVGSASQGVVLKNSTGSTFTNNTISGNGVGTDSASGNAAGMTFRTGCSGHTVQLNEFTANYGAGLNVNDGATGIEISQNAFSGNGTIVARNGDPATGQIGIDLNNPTDDASAGTAPFYTLNDDGDPDPGGNALLNFAILDTSQIIGANLELTGWARPGSVIEVFVAAADPSGFGEGQTHKITLTEGGTGGGGEDPSADLDATSSAYTGLINGIDQGDDTTNRFRFRFLTPAGVADGTQLTATAHDGSSNTSEFGGLVTTEEVLTISGAVFEDTVGDLLTDGPIGGAGNPGLQSVNVYLYNDDGTTPGEPDGSDTLLSGPLATDSNGDYVFLIPPSATYWVVVDSGTIGPDAGLNPTWALSDTWAEQTYGPEGAVAFSGSYSFLSPAGAFYGGKQATVSDNAPGGLLGAEHAARVVVAAASVGDIDFGFSFNVVTNVAAPDSGQFCCRSVQGSLDQFVQNSSVVAGPNAMRFVPAVSTNAAGGGGSWWRIQHVLPVSSRLQYYDFDTIIDGTAYDSADGVTLVNPNPGFLGVNAGGGITVGADDVALPQVNKPELEVFGRGFSPSFKSSAGTQTDRSEIRDISAWGANAIFSSNGATVPAVTLLDLRYENNVIGAPPGAFVDPGVGNNPSSCVSFSAADNGQIVNNLIGFCDRSLIHASKGAGWTITGNEFRDGGTIGAPEDAIHLGIGATVPVSGVTVEENHVEGHGGNGIDVNSGAHTIRNNTIVGNGLGGGETTGIRLATDGNLVDRNVIQGNTGPGILVVGQDAGFGDSPAQQNQITQNEFGGNGGPAIDLVASGGDQALGDGPTANDQTPPNCGYDNNGGNRLIDTPVIDSASLTGPTTTVTGRACASSTVEIYRAAVDEGDLYLGSTTTDGAGDFSAGVTGLAPGESVIAIVRDGSNDTSEFGNAFSPAVVASISGTVFEDIVGDVLDDGVIGDVNNPGIASVDVYLYDDTNGDGIPDAGEPLTGGVTNPATTNGTGDYIFSPLPPGDYLVVVDSPSVDPTQTFVASPSHWAEQTYGATGARCADWVAGTVTRGSDGPCYGGRRGAIFDDHASGIENAEHVVGVTLAATPVTDVDQGFSFNVVTNLGGGRDGLWSAKTGQGTIDMVLRNATAITVPNTMRFVPALSPNMTGAVFGGQWWRIDIDGFSSPFLIADVDTTVDGTAFDYADGTTVLDTNPGFMGANSAGGLTAGLDASLLPQVERPELEIRGNLTVWIDADRSIVQDLAITAGIGLVQVYDATDVRIRRNVLGSEPDDFVEPADTAVSGVHVRDGGADGFIENNLIGFSYNGVQLGTTTKAATGWQITGNEIRGCTDGVEMWQLSPGNTVQGNLIAGNWYGVRDRAGSGTVHNNTITASHGHGVVLAASDTSVTRNIIEAGLDTEDGDPVHGILALGDETPGYANSPARSNRISDNRFGSNSGIAIDLAAMGVGIAGDGVTPNDGGTDATHGHDKLDHPVITSAIPGGPTVTIVGTACSSCTVEIYRAVADGDGSDTDSGSDYGEGIELVATVAANVAGDFSVAGVAGLAEGDHVSAIAFTTAAGPADTSEFGPNVTVGSPKTISGVVFEDVNYGGGVGRDLTTASADAPTFTVERGGVTVELYDAAGGLAGTTVTAGDGSYSFTGLSPGLYTVRVVNEDVTSSRPGSDGSELAVQTYRVDGDGESVGTGAKKVGGELPSNEDAAANSGAQTLASLQGTDLDSDGVTEWTQSIVIVDATGGDVTAIDFGFNFDVIVNTNDAGQGSLRQFILNSNLLAQGTSGGGPWELNARRRVEDRA